MITKSIFWPRVKRVELIYTALNFLNMFVPHKILVIYALHANLLSLFTSHLCFSCASLSLLVWLVEKLVIPVSLWAEVTHQMAGPEQRTCIGAKRCEEDSRSLHIALESHKAHWDIHRRYVIGVPLRRQQKRSINWWRRDNTEVSDRLHASKLKARERLGKCIEPTKHAWCLWIKGNLSFTTLTTGRGKLIYFYTLTELTAKHWENNWRKAKQARILISHLIDLEMARVANETHKSTIAFIRQSNYSTNKDV